MLNQYLRLNASIIDVDDRYLATLHLCPTPEVGAERFAGTLVYLSIQLHLEDQSYRVYGWVGTDHAYDGVPDSPMYPLHGGLYPGKPFFYDPLANRFRHESYTRKLVWLL